MTRKRPALVAAFGLAALSLTTAAATAQSMNHARMLAQGGHAAMMGADAGNDGNDRNDGGGPLTEPGQGAFAAIAEIVRRLSADPATDWSKVDIDALRAHLVDMDMLVTRAAPVKRPVAGGAEFTIRLTGDAAGAVRRMVPAHAPVLAAETGWTAVARIDGDRAVLRVTSLLDEQKIRALGFFGLMATGDHHRAHHWAMAAGTMTR